jgi:transcription antitermination factor NusG
MKWAIVLIDNKKRETIEQGLKRFKIPYEIGIPLVKVLRKRFKNKDFFDHIPLLFNYGFIKLPNKFLKSREKLMEIKNRCPGVFSWMYCMPNERGYIVETVPEYVVKDLMERADRLSIFSASDMNKFNKGDFIILKGYPFDGLGAEIISINNKTKKVKVNVFIMSSVREVQVNFENIFYSIYGDFDESLSPKSLDEIEGRYKNSLDRLEFKNSKK